MGWWRRCLSGKHVLLAILVLLVGQAVSAQVSRWGVLDEIARREWTTEKEPRARVTLFKWEREGQVLVARHGFQERLKFGADRFADTVQRFVLNPKTGAIDVTYNYEDGRPPLKTVIRIQPDGTAIETFTDANGVQKRNIYRSPSLSLNLIERQELRNGSWASLGQTRKAGLTQDQIAENKRVAEEQRQAEIARREARAAERRAQEDAERAQRDAEYAEEEAASEARREQMRNSFNVLDAMDDINRSLQRRNAEQKARFDAQVASDVARERARAAEQARERARAAEQARAQAAEQARERERAATASRAPAPAPVRDPWPAPNPNERRERKEVADVLAEGGTSKGPGKLEPMKTNGRDGERTCTDPARTRPWKSSMSALTLGDVQAEYNSVKARPCSGGGGSITPMVCPKQARGFGLTFVGQCTATVSCPARTRPCSPRVSAE